MHIRGRVRAFEVYMFVIFVVNYLFYYYYLSFIMLNYNISC